MTDNNTITAGMELTEPNGTDDVYLIKEVRGDDATVSIWNDGRRKRKQRMDVSELHNEYTHGELVEA